jgi:hypothetical protein
MNRAANLSKSDALKEPEPRIRTPAQTEFVNKSPILGHEPKLAPPAHNVGVRPLVGFGQGIGDLGAKVARKLRVVLMCDSHIERVLSVTKPVGVLDEPDQQLVGHAVLTSSFLADTSRVDNAPRAGAHDIHCLVKPVANLRPASVAKPRGGLGCMPSIQYRGWQAVVLSSLALHLSRCVGGHYPKHRCPPLALSPGPRRAIAGSPRPPAVCPGGRELILERTRDGLRRAYKNGKQTGRIPYGYDIDEQGEFVVVPEEAALVRQIISNIASGATLYSESKRLNDEGIPSPGYRYRGDDGRRRTRSWSPSSVRMIVRQTAYSGVHRVHLASQDGEDEIIERPVPAIVEPGLRERAEAQRDRNKSRAGELRKNRRNYLLSGLVRCGICGLSCKGRTVTSRVSGGTKTYVYYGCISYRPELGGEGSESRILPHRAPNVAAKWLEDLVWADVRRFWRTPAKS